MTNISEIPEKRLINVHQLYVIVEKIIENITTGKGYSREDVLEMFRELEKKEANMDRIINCELPDIDLEAVKLICESALANE